MKRLTVFWSLCLHQPPSDPDPSGPEGMISVAISSHYFFGRDQRTAQLEEILRRFPTWAFPSSWVSTYDMYRYWPRVTSQTPRRAESQQWGVGVGRNTLNGTPLLPLRSEGNTLSRERPPSLCQAGLVAKLARAARCEHGGRLTDWPASTAASLPGRSGTEEKAGFLFLKVVVLFFLNSICRAFALTHFTPHSSHRFLTFSVSHLSWSVSDFVETVIFGKWRRFYASVNTGKREMQKITTWSKSSYDKNIF